MRGRQRLQLDTGRSQHHSALFGRLVVRLPEPALGLACLIKPGRPAAPLVAPVLGGNVAAAEGRVQVVEQRRQLQCHLDALLVQRLQFGGHAGQRRLPGAGLFLQPRVVRAGLVAGQLRLVARGGGGPHGAFLLFDLLQLAACGQQLCFEPCAALVFLGQRRAGAGVAHQRMAVPRRPGLLQRLMDGARFGGDGAQLLDARLDRGTLAGLAVGVGHHLVAAAHHFRLQAGQHGLQGAVVMPVGMLVCAADRAGGIVFQRGAQLFHAFPAGCFGQLQRPFGLRKGGHDAHVFLAGRGQLRLRRGLGLVQLGRLGIQLAAAALARVELQPQFFRTGQQVAPLLELAALLRQLPGRAGRQRPDGFLAPGFQFLHGGGRCGEPLAGLFLLFALRLRDTLRARQLARQFFGLRCCLPGLHEQHFPTLPGCGQGLPLLVLLQPDGAAFLRRLQLAAPFLLVAQGVAGLGIRLVGLVAQGGGLPVGRHHRFDAGVQRLGLVQLRRGRALGLFGFQQLRRRPGQGIRCLLLRQPGLRRLFRAGGDGRPGARDVAVDARHVVGQRACGLHRFDTG